MFSGKGLNQIEEEKERKVTLYVLNNFIKFERKLYQFAGLPFGRPIKIKTIGYFGGIFIIGLIIYFTPGINRLIRWIPPGLLILIPITVAWLLSDLGTEGRSPLKFFSSFFKYQYRKIKGSLHYRNKKIPKFRTYMFNNYVSHSNFDFATSGIDINELNSNEVKLENKATKKFTMFKRRDNSENEQEVSDNTDVEVIEDDIAEIKEENNVETNKEKSVENVVNDVDNVDDEFIEEKDDIFGYLFEQNENDYSNDISDFNEVVEMTDFLSDKVSDNDTTENITIDTEVQKSDEQELNKLIKTSVDNNETVTPNNKVEQKSEKTAVVKREKNKDKDSMFIKLKKAIHGIDFSKFKNNKKLLFIGAGALVFVVVFSAVLLINQGNTSSESDDNNVSMTENSNNELNLNEEDHLLKGIKASSRQNYEEATEHFDLVDFNTLEKDDKEIVLLSYLYTDQVEKILELEPEFDEVVVSYYQAKENLSKIRSLQDLSDEFKFAIAVEDDDYNKIIELRKKVNLDEDKEVAIIRAFIELDEVEDALSFAKETENTRYIKQLEELVKDKGKNKKKENDDD